MRSLTARVVTLVVVVVLSSAVITGFALARVSGATNEERALATLRQDAALVAAAAETRRATLARGRGEVPAAVTAAQRRLARSGITMAFVPADDAVAPSAPFSVKDVATLRDGGSLQARRKARGQNWIVTGAVTESRPLDAVLVAQPVRQVVRLSAAQRRRLLVSLALGLLGGALAGLVLARGVTVPLGRVAAAARRLSAGERDVRVEPRGPAEVADVAVALDGLSRALATSEQRQRTFLLNVSHELRTPLTAVTGYAEALADGALPPSELAGAAAVIRDEAARLQHRVEDLLALARMEADDFRLEPGWVDIGALLHAAAVACRPRAVRSGVVLGVEAPPEGPVIWTDGERLRQAVDALADNALRVLPAGAPLVLAVRQQDQAGQPGSVRVEVRDGGPGLAPEDLAVAFERGRLQERYRGSRPVGSGLGLALVGELARRMGGYAQAGHAPEGGACFALVLPIGTG